MLLVAGLGMVTIVPLFTFPGAEPDPAVREFMLIWYPGAVFLVVPIVANAAIRAGGDTRFPAMMMVAPMVFACILQGAEEE